MNHELIIQDVQTSNKPDVREGWELHLKGCRDAIKNAKTYRAETMARGNTIPEAMADLLDSYDGELRNMGYHENDVRILPCAMSFEARMQVGGWKKINKNVGGANAFFIHNMFKNLEKI